MCYVGRCQVRIAEQATMSCRTSCTAALQDVVPCQHCESLLYHGCSITDTGSNVNAVRDDCHPSMAKHASRKVRCPYPSPDNIEDVLDVGACVQSEDDSAKN